MSRGLVLSGPGEAIDRRTALARAWRAGAVAALGAGVPGLLAACGKTTAGGSPSSTFFFAYGTDFGLRTPPFGDLVQLIDLRAKELNVAPVVTGFSGNHVDGLRDAASPSLSRDPNTGKFPRRFDVVVNGLPDSPHVAAITADAMRRGVKFVSFLLEHKPRTAAISVDVARMGVLLATHVARWADERVGGRGRVLIVGPNRYDLGANRVVPFASVVPEALGALRATLARTAPGLKLTTTTDSAQIAPALKAHPDVRIVLCWNDGLALSAARSLRALRGGARERLYVGALGQPALTSRETIDELRRDDVLRAVVAASLRDLANASVDLPTTLLLGQAAHDIVIAPRLLTPSSRALAAEARDFSRDPDAVFKRLGVANAAALRLNPPADPRARRRMRSPAGLPAGSTSTGG